MVYSQRGDNLKELATLLPELRGCSVPEFVEMPASTFADIQPPTEGVLTASNSDGRYDRPATAIIEHYLSEINALGIVEEIDETSEPLLNKGAIMVRCAPVIDDKHLHLSFAGTYPSFIPKPIPQNPEAVHNAAASVLAGKHTEYARYYTERHGVADTEAALGVMLMELVSNPAVHGTGYSYKGNIRSEYVFDPQLNNDQYAEQTGVHHLIDDRFGVVVESAKGEFTDAIEFNPRVTQALRAIENHFGYPVDVEYLVSADGVINIVQVRPMSGVHLDNWRRYYEQSHADINLSKERRAIINSVGRLTIADRSSVVDHSNTFHYVNTLRSGTNASDGLIVVHGLDRARDHLQYAVLEDPLINNVYHADPDELHTILGHQTNAYSNGDTYF